MESILSCGVCYVEYNEIMVPKMLDCGHSFCLLCIKKLLETNPNCPNCRNELNEAKIADEYPTNYLVLEYLKKMKIHESKLEFPFQLEKKIEDRTEILKKKISFHSSRLEQAKDDLALLQDLTDSETKTLNVKKAKLVLDKLENKHKMENEILSDFESLKSTVNINLLKFKTSDDYLTEIYKRLLNEEKIYAVKNVEEIVKYGEVSFQDNLILFHALSETHKPDQASLIWFDDLKNCVTETNFFTFLKLSCNKKKVIQLVTVKMYDTQLASKFIALCTGECGPSYKMSQYTKRENEDNETIYKEILELIVSFDNSLQCSRRFDYISKKTNDKRSEKDDAVICVHDEGEFSVDRRLAPHTFSNDVGKVESPQNIWNSISFTDALILMVLDCGICFKL